MADATADTLAAILAELRLLHRKVDALARRDGFDVARLAAFLQAVYAFSRTSPWTASELLADARTAGRRDLLNVCNEIVGERGDACKRLGRWCERHAGAVAGELRLVRVKREAGAWLYAAEPWELGE